MNEVLNLSNEIILNVNTFEDQNDGSENDGLSLRDAVIIASLDLENKYIINLPAGTYDLFLPDGSLKINNVVTIRGASSAETVIDASFLGTSIIELSSGFATALTLENVTLQNSFRSAINISSPSGKATINNSFILKNQGGGIVNSGQLELNNSMVLNNFSSDGAGGLQNNGSGLMTINNSTISFNASANSAGGILNNFQTTPDSAGGTLTITNSTVSGNVSFSGFGGGILTKTNPEVLDAPQTIVTTTIINSTITNNQASRGSGIFSQENSLFSNNVVVRNSIIADNIGSADMEGFYNNSSSYNLIGYASSTNLLNGFNNNTIGTIDNPIDALISPLQDNGGSTFTHALLEGSPAINAGENSVTQIRSLFTTSPVTDQRGEPRISGQFVDLGSYEFTSPSGIADETFSSELNTSIFRFQNQNLPGTYLFVGQEERQNIKTNFLEFKEEGEAFKVGIAPNDDLIPLYRFQNLNSPGTYLYTGEQERQSILQNNPNFQEEGIAFYVYGVGSNQGENIYRLQNSDLPGTYLFVGEQERQNILQNFTRFVDEGIAFQVSL